MNTHQISPDDPRLTAYACNEMAAGERVEFEKLLSADPGARQTVEEIRAAGALLATVLEHEPVSTAPADGRQAAIIPGGDFRKLDGGGAPGGQIKQAKDLLSQPIRFPQFYYMVSGLAAACFAVFFVYWQKNQPGIEQKQYVEVDLATFQKAKAAADEARNEKSGQPAAPVVAVIQAGPAAGADEVVVLSPFMTKPEAVGTMAGTRLNTEPKEVGTAMTIASEGRPAEVRKLHLAAPLQPEFNTEAYGYRKDNDYLRVTDHPRSTFSIDVDTAAYANVRRFLTQGQRPPADAVRLEELVNYFPYHYAPPTGDVPFAAHLEVASAPWAPAHRLVRIGLKGREVSDAQRPAANLVFLLDVSGSMQHANKLPLVKQSLRLLVNKLRADDRVAIAVYAGSSGLALPSTPANRRAEILEAIDRLEAGGSTNGAMGIHLAYDVAKANFVEGGVNRVILATDGDFNVGTTSEGDLVRLVEEKAKSGVFLTVLGFGMGNLKDGTLEQIADKGNGNYAYIDSLAEAKKTLVEQAGGTLVTIAKDVKIQVEFNPAQVAAYRLIGYENRLLAKEDFNNDAVDAGEIGAGHTITALYEVVPAWAELSAAAPAVDALKYQKVETPNAKNQTPNSQELLTVKIRYKEPSGDVSNKLEFALRDAGARFEDASVDFKFAAAVAGFGMALRDSPHRGSLSLAEVSAWGRAGLGNDAGGYRHEFLGLVEKAEAVLQ
jgi:Ca-activated chloride channel family protein